MKGAVFYCLSNAMSNTLCRAATPAAPETSLFPLVCESVDPSVPPSLEKIVCPKRPRRENTSKSLNAWYIRHFHTAYCFTAVIAAHRRELLVQPTSD